LRSFVKLAILPTMNPNERGLGRYRFGLFVLDSRRRLVTRNGQAIPLRPTLFDALLFLVENPGRVVTKDELFEAVWRGRIVGESNISQTMSALRKALGPGHAIVTAPAQGYRFTATVTALSNEGEEAAAPAGFLPKDHRRAFQLGVGFGAVLLAVGGGFVALQPWRAAPASSPASMVVVADFQNLTGNPIFDKTLASATEIDLRQSPRVMVLTSPKIQDTLAAMTRDRNSPLTPAVAQEVCVRNNGQETLEGSVAEIGAKYMLTMTATRCADGKVIAAEKALVDTPGGLLPALDGLVDHVRRNLGETDRSVEAFNVPLVSRRTASLEAPKAYSDAKYLFDHGRRLEAIPLYQHAIELDPKFAMAYADLAFTYAGLHEDKSAAELITRAYALRDVAGERDKWAIAVQYGMIVTGDDLRLIRDLKSLTLLYPDDPGPQLTLASEEDWLGRIPAAIADGRRALALAPNEERPYEILIRAYLLANQVGQAHEVADQAIAHHVDGEMIHKRLFEIAVAQDDIAAQTRELAWARDKPGERVLLIDAAQAALREGQLRRAGELFDRARQLGESAGLGDYTAAPFARLLNDLGLAARARQVLAQVPAGFDSTDYRVSLAEVGDTARAVAVLKVALAKKPANTLLNGVSAPQTRAALAMRSGKPAEAVEALKPAAPYEMTDFSVPYLRGEAYLAMSDGPRAAAEFQKILNNRGVEPLSLHYPLARLGLARALRIEGERAASRQAYAQFLSEWRAADADIPVLQAARAEYAKL
jgi:eukaryotic-like serine/threonine-protein kinase